jgi:hypothetical protein
MIQKPWIEIIGACRTSLTGYTSTASVVFGGEGRCMESSITYIRFWDSQAENGSHSSRRNHSELVRLTVWLSARSLLVHALRFSIMTQCMLNSIQMVLRSYKQNSIHDTNQGKKNFRYNVHDRKSSPGPRTDKKKSNHRVNPEATSEPTEGIRFLEESTK